jgi:peptide/nickel transport system ATP-binding protein
MATDPDDPGTRPIIERSSRLRADVGFSSRVAWSMCCTASASIFTGARRPACGESGSGKSVTARTILNMVPRPGQINGGRILFRPGDGAAQDLTALDPGARPSGRSGGRSA